MNISLQNETKVSARLNVVIEPIDYEEKLEKELKNYRKKASIPGFRVGMAPIALIRRQIGKEVLMEVVERLLQKSVYDYIIENKIDILGSPMPVELDELLDFDNPKDFTFCFDLAMRPQFELNVNKDDTMDTYSVTITDEMVDKRAKEYSQRMSKYDEVDNFEGNDLLKGTIQQLDENGNTVEEGIKAENAVMMPFYMKNDDQKKLFEGAKVNDVITFCPWQAFGENETELTSLLNIKKDEIENAKGQFSYQIATITRAIPAEMNEELFNNIFPGKEIKTIDEFKEAIKNTLAAEFRTISNNKFELDLQKYLKEKVGELELDEALLKKLLSKDDDKETAEAADKKFQESLDAIKWQLITEKLGAQFNITVDEADIKATAKEHINAQFARYGYSESFPDSILEQYATEFLSKDNNKESMEAEARIRKTLVATKEAMTLNVKEVTPDELYKMF